MVQIRHYLTLRQPELKWMQRTVTSMELGLFIAQVAGMNWEEMDLMVRSMSGQLELMKPGMKIPIRL